MAIGPIRSGLRLLSAGFAIALTGLSAGAQSADPPAPSIEQARDCTISYWMLGVSDRDTPLGGAMRNRSLAALGVYRKQAALSVEDAFKALNAAGRPRADALRSGKLSKMQLVVEAKACDRIYDWPTVDYSSAG